MLLSRQQVRELDHRASAEYGIPGAVLMENAGRGAAILLRSLAIHGPVVVCCGKGNNGGDGFVIARYLDLFHVRVHVLLFAKPNELTGDAASHFQTIRQAGLPITCVAEPQPEWSVIRSFLHRAEWIVDALFGTGLKGAVKAPFDDAIREINHSGGRVFAVDIPSGLDCDTGQSFGVTVRAHYTATFVAEKKGFHAPSAAEWLGQVHVVDIGVPRELLEKYAALAAK